MVDRSAQKTAAGSAGFEPNGTRKTTEKRKENMKFLQKDLTASNSGEQVKSAVPCTFRNHAAALKSAATVHYVDGNGIDKTFYALNSSLDPLFDVADEYDSEVITACLLVAGYRSGRDLTALENAVKTAESAAAPPPLLAVKNRRRARSLYRYIGCNRHGYIKIFLEFLANLLIYSENIFIKSCLHCRSRAYNGG